VLRGRLVVAHSPASLNNGKAKAFTAATATFATLHWVAGGVRRETGKE
jgi:hypothetical protein